MLTDAAEVIETVDVRLLSNLSDNFRSPYEAILELVDNALAARLPARPLVVTIAGSGGIGGTLRVVAKGGHGMGLGELSEFFRWGKAPDARGLNRYGQGGKAAIGYLGTGVRIISNRYDEETAYRIEDADWLSRPDGKPKRFLPKADRPPVPGSGVVQIEILGLRKRINLRHLERELAWRYRPALTSGQLKLLVGRRQVRPVDLPVEREHRFERPLLVPAIDDPERMMSIKLGGWVGIAPARVDDFKGGVRCSAYGRVVLQNAYFGHRTASYKASLNNLVGEVDLSFVPVVLNKNSFDEGSRAWHIAAEVMRAELQPYIDQLLKRKETSEPSDEERERAMAAKDLAHWALEQLAAEAERLGRAGRQMGRKPPERRDERVDHVLREEAEARVREPRTPPPRDAVGELPRTGSGIDWDVRALDPRIRSATELLPHGRTEVIINSEFPLYRERDGDDFYMLETGLLEELRPTAGDEDKTVAEYAEQVNDALFLVMTRAQKQTRRRRK